MVDGCLVFQTLIYIYKKRYNHMPASVSCERLASVLKLKTNFRIEHSCEHNYHKYQAIFFSTGLLRDKNIQINACFI